MSKRCNKCIQDKELPDFNRCQNNRDGYQYTCRSCQTEYRKSRRSYFSKYSRDYYDKNQAQCLKTVAAYRLKNRPEVLRVQRLWYDRNSDKAKAGSITWAKNNPEKVREYSRKKKARKLNQLGYFNPWMIKYYRYIQKDCCFYCDEDISDGFQLEHMMPLSRGGMHCWSNTVLSCQPCNYHKHTKTVEEFCEG